MHLLTLYPEKKYLYVSPHFLLSGTELECVPSVTQPSEYTVPQLLAFRVVEKLESAACFCSAILAPQ